MRLIETDAFPFEFLSRLAERESWRKEVHRPIYHVHKWWAKRLGTIFRGILLGTALPEESDLATAFYKSHRFRDVTVFDPFMGSGTTIGEAHKLGFTALGRDINPVAVEPSAQPSARWTGAACRLPSMSCRGASGRTSGPYTDPATPKAALATYSISSGPCRCPAWNAASPSISSPPG